MTVPIIGKKLAIPKKKKTQNKAIQADMILKRLKEGHPISSWTAIQRYGCTRLASIIFNLKKEGYDIRTNIIKDGTKKFARYKLNQEIKF